MQSSSAALQKLIVWYEQRQLRERILLLLCVLAVLFFVWDSLVFGSIGLRKKAVRNESNRLQLEVAELMTREQLVEARKGFDPDRDNRLLLEQLQADLTKDQRQLEESVGSLISPRQMPALLRQLLSRQQKLKLLSLENLPAEQLRIDEQVAEEELGPVLYRHRLRLEFSGEYLATLRYLKKLENLPRRLVWEKVEIETLNYPQAKVLLQVYTLSLEKGWIGG